MADAELNARLRAARLYVVSSDGDPADQARVLCAAIDGGADIVQLRNKQASPAHLYPAAVRIREHAHTRLALFIVNDHLELAIEAEADGVHLGQDDLPLGEARRRWDGIIGRSTHSLEQAMEAQEGGADYIGVGPVFATPTKPGRPPVGLELVASVASTISIPWFAIGGIDDANIDDVLRAGARRLAVVRAVSAAVDPAAAAARLQARLSAPVGAP
jgi:thiamine-phosphate pyrophosphorylase